MIWFQYGGEGTEMQMENFTCKEDNAGHPGLGVLFFFIQDQVLRIENFILGICGKALLSFHCAKVI